MLAVVRVAEGKPPSRPPPPSPQSPSFQDLLPADLHMKWYLIHFHSVESPKPAVAEALAEGRPRGKKKKIL